MINPTQVATLQETMTKPVMVVLINHGGFVEQFSCGQEVLYDGDSYTAGGIVVSSINNGKEASLELPADSARITQVQNGTWRHGVCQIIALPAVSGDSTFSLSDGIICLDGTIVTSRWSKKKITIKAIHKHLTGNRTPRNTINELTEWLNPAGSVLTWEGDKITLEPPR